MCLPSISAAPRKGSEEHFDRLYRLSGEIPLIDDTWLYHWTSKPPESFVYHKILFRRCTPAEISKNGWIVLKPALKEIGTIFGVSTSPSGEKMTADDGRLELISLNHHYYRSCFMGIYGDEYVVAATPHKRPSFIPFDLYRTLSSGTDWKNMQCFAGYRHFQSQFDTGCSFYTERQNLLCKISYGIDIGVYGLGFLWAVLNVDGTLIPAPFRISLARDLSDLPSKVEQINADCLLFTQKLGAFWLREHGDEIFMLLRHLVRTTPVPQSVLTSLRTNPQLETCRTRLDLLLILMNALKIQPSTSPSLIRLSQQFIPRKKEKQ